MSILLFVAVAVLGFIAIPSIHVKYVPLAAIIQAVLMVAAITLAVKGL